MYRVFLLLSIFWAAVSSGSRAASSFNVRTCVLTVYNCSSPQVVQSHH